MIVFFVLLLVIVQIGFLVAARSLATTAVEASARRVAAGADIEMERARIANELDASVPGVEVRSVSIRAVGTTVRVVVEAGWTAPGPDLVPVTFDLASTRPMTVAP